MEAIEGVAAASVAILMPYLVEAGKSVAKKAGEAVWSQAESIYKAIQSKFKGNPVAEEALSDAAKNPGDPDNQAALRKELRKALETDKSFLDELRKLVAESSSGGIDVSGSGAVATSGGTAAGAGGIAVKGNVEGGIHMGKSDSEKR